MVSLKDFGTDKIYYIGGIVRDELLGRKCLDIDVTYEGNAIEFCQNLKLDGVEVVQINDSFGTVRIKIGDEVVDFASTRDEKYLKKGHLPEVENIGCSLEKDVLRRDFTINAIAKSVSTGEIIDYTNGKKDLELKLLRVLHDESFIDDPTRIVRALKFAVRFGFELEEHTYNLQKKYLENVNYDMSYKRLKKELIETFNLNSQKAYDKFFDYEIYKLLSEDTPEKSKYNIEELVNRYYVENVWLVYLGAMNLDSLPLTKIEKKIVEDYKVLSALPELCDDFDIYKAFEKVEKEAILIYTAMTGSKAGLRFFEIKDIKPSINGKDLKELGINPSPKYEKCFDYILSQKLKTPEMTRSEELELAKEFFKLG